MNILRRVFKHKINILSMIEVILLGIFLYLLFKIGILSNTYLIIITICSIMINALSIFFMNLKNKLVKIIGIIIAVIAILISSAGTYYLYKGNKFLTNSFNHANKEVLTYYVVANKSSAYKQKTDIKKTLSYYENTVNIKKALEFLEKDLTFETNAYQNITSMFNDTINNNTNLFLIDKDSYKMLFELDKTFNEKDFKIIYKFDIETKSSAKKSNKKESFNIYVGGTDFAGLMDYNAIVTINTKTKEILLTAIPRDYYMEIYGMEGKMDSLSHMSFFGSNTNMKSLEQFFDTTIDYDIRINTESLVGLVDTIGGITYCSDQSFTTTHALVLNTYDDKGKQKLYVKKGCQELNGIETLTVARERNAFVGRDRVRQKNCQKIIMAIFEKLKSTNSIVNYDNILESLSNLYTTTIPRSVVSDIAKSTLDGADWTFITQSVDGGDGNVYITVLNDMGYAMIPNPDDVINAKNKIEEILKK